MTASKSHKYPPISFDKDVIWHLVLCAIFISFNFMLFLFPILAIGTWYFHSKLCYVLLLLQFVDVMIPVHPGPRGFWSAFSKLTDNTNGLQKYNHLELIVEEKDDKTTYDKSKNYLLCYFPHSLYGAALFGLRRYYEEHHDMTMLFSGADVILHVPFLRRLMTWWGMTRVSKHALKETLGLPFPHNVLMFQPDGIAGMFYGLEQEQIVLNKRRGFCKIALQTGASLVPCYVLGANDLYDRTMGPTSWAAQLSHHCHASLVFWRGRFGVPFGCFPKPVKLVVVVGPPLDAVARVEQPTQEQIDALHQRFVTALKELYQRHKHRMGVEWAQSHDRLYLESEPLPRPHKKLE